MFSVAAVSSCLSPGSSHSRLFPRHYLLFNRYIVVRVTLSLEKISSAVPPRKVPTWWDKGHFNPIVVLFQVSFANCYLFIHLIHVLGWSKTITVSPRVLPVYLLLNSPFPPSLFLADFSLLVHVLVFNIKWINIPFATRLIVHLSPSTALLLLQTISLLLFSGLLCYSVCECPKTLVGR